jgi:hypothetical protein
LSSKTRLLGQKNCKSADMEMVNKSKCPYQVNALIKYCFYLHTIVIMIDL